MIIDFNKMAFSELENFKGGENIFNAKMFFDGTNRILFGKLEKNATIGLHTHSDDCEIIYIIDGQGKSICDGKEEILEKGMCHYCGNGHSHCLMNNGTTDLVFFAVVPAQPKKTN